MSGQWEVVRGKNEKRSKVPVPKPTSKQGEDKSKKRNILNGVKIEEVLPKSQVQSLYSGKQNKENKPQDKPIKHAETKKPEKKPSKGSAEPPKPKPPKSIEAGLLSISTEEFHLVYDRSKTAFPETPIVWLKELTQYLNQKLPLEIQDPVFSNKPPGYPLSVMPVNLRTILEKAIQEAGTTNSQLYFDIALTSMVTDLSKGLPAVGYRFFLQYIALNEPQLVTENLPKHISLRNSYQNRANVALSIMWAVGHVGVKDLHSGLKVFEELKLPLLDMKSYSRYIIKYLLELTSRDHDSHLSKEQFLLILDTIFSNKKNFPTELQQDLVQNFPRLKKLLLNNKRESLSGLVETFLKKIASTTNATYQNFLCNVLVEVFNKDQSTLAAWSKVYSKNLVASAVLLRYISNSYNAIKPNVKKAFKELLLNFFTVNEELSLKKRKDDGLKEAIAAVKKAQEQKQTEAPGKSWFKKLLSKLLLVLCIGIMAEPFLKPYKPKNDLYLFRLGKKVGDVGLWTDSQLQVLIPSPYYGQAKAVAEPYGALAGDLLKTVINIHDNVREAIGRYADEKYPVVVASIENYAPGLLDNAQGIFTDTFAKTIYYYHTSINYLQKEVFIGQLSPENIQRVVVGAYNTTSEKAVEYYHWVYQKVQTSIK